MKHEKKNVWLEAIVTGGQDARPTSPANRTQTQNFVMRIDAN
jgi:hypothetical protein